MTQEKLPHRKELCLQSDLRYKNCTANISSKSRYNPHVFTEQGLYMLMTVLKGPLAVKQSKALIRTFKKMKDRWLNSNHFCCTHNQ